MSRILGGFASYIGGAFWWICDKIWGDRVFSALKPMMPDWVVGGIPMSDALRLAQTWVPFVVLIVIGTALYWRGSRLNTKSEPNGSSGNSISDLTKLSNSELVAMTIQFAQGMRNFESNADLTKDLRMATPPDNLSQAQLSDFVQKSVEQFHQTHNRVQTEFRNTYLHPAIQLRNEIRGRLQRVGIFVSNGTVQEMPNAPSITVPLSALEGRLTGPHPIADAADWLESNARRLPL